MKKNIALFFIASSFLIFPGCSWFSRQETSNQKSESSFVVIKNDADFKTKVLDNKKPIIVKFTANWCGACKAIEPLYEELAHTYKDTHTFAILDIDQARAQAKEHKIQGIPAFLFFNNGKEIDSSLRIVGMFQKEEFISKMNQAFNPASK